jgi:hypothetical protein
MASININELPLITNATDSDVLVINVNNQVTSAINVANFKNAVQGYFPYGTATLPSISFLGDEDTGFFHPGAAATNTDNNYVAVTTGGVQRAVWSAVGNYGIGTTDPTSRLSVNGEVRVDIGQKTFQIKADFADDEVLLTTITDDPLLLGSNNTEAARITTGGEFLIGTTLNPNNSQLTVNGTTTTDGVVISSGGITGGAQLASAVEFIQFNAAGAVDFGGANSYGTAGQLLESEGPDAPPTWTDFSFEIPTFDFRNLPNVATAP